MDLVLAASEISNRCRVNYSNRFVPRKSGLRQLTAMMRCVGWLCSQSSVSPSPGLKNDESMEKGRKKRRKESEEEKEERRTRLTKKVKFQKLSMLTIKRENVTTRDQNRYKVHDEPKKMEYWKRL